MLLNCSMMANYTAPDQNRQFNVSWQCQVLSEDRQSIYFSLQVLARYKISFITSQKIAILLTATSLLDFQLSSASPAEYQIDDPYTAKLMVISGLNSTLATTVAESGALPLPGLSVVDWDGTFMAVRQESAVR